MGNVQIADLAPFLLILGQPLAGDSYSFTLNRPALDPNPIQITLSLGPA